MAKKKPIQSLAASSGAHPERQGSALESRRPAAVHEPSEIAAESPESCAAETDDEELELLEPQEHELDDEAVAVRDHEEHADHDHAVHASDDERELGHDAELEGEALVPSQRSLALRDPLQAYVNEARRHALLSSEEERELALRYYESGDVAAARQLVTANLRLVIKIAHEYRRAYRNLLDLIQEGNIGLMHAVKKFDPYRGVKLSSYAAWWIRAYILKFILNNWRLVKIGTTQNQRKLFFNLRKEVEALQRMGIDNPAPRLLAERLDVPEHEVQSMQKRLAGGDVSLDAPLRADESGATRLDLVATATAGPDQQVEEQEFSRLIQQKVQEFGRQLRGRDREVFELRTVAEEPLTLQQIGDRYGITRERARQIERRVMDRLRDYLRAELGDAVDVALGSSESTA